jgi:pilus assembly protein CpaB
MSKLRIVLLAFTALAAVGAGLMARNFASRKPASTDPQVVEINKVKTSQVLVATKDLKFGEKLAGGALAWRAWPQENLGDGMITQEAQPDALEKMELGRARANIFSGETIVGKKIVIPGDKGFLAAMLPKGMRAISVAVSERSSAGGFILPNDRVDVILTKKINADGGQQLVTSETVISNVRVLAINQTFQQDQESDTISVPEGKTATLELGPRESEVIAQVESTGELSLALRSIAESDGLTMEQNSPELAEKYTGNGKPGSSDTLFVRYGRETYATNR